VTVVSMKGFPRPRLLLFSGVLLALSFQPFDLLIPPFVALVPLFCFVEGAGNARQLVKGGVLVGVCFWVAVLYWVALFSAVGFAALVLYMSVYPILFLLGLNLLWKRARLPLWLVAPVLWVALEHLRASGELAFTWAQLCYSLSYHPILLQTADVVGPYGLTFWIVLVNALIFMALIQSGRPRPLPLAFLALVLLIPLAYGYRCLREETLLEGDEINVSLIQPNIEQDQKWSRSYRDTTFQILEALSSQSLSSNPDIIVWPETAVPAYVKHDAASSGRISAAAEGSGVAYLVGSQDYDRVGEKDFLVYNSAFLFHRDGLMDEERYSKMRLVPFGEKLPYESYFSSLKGIKYKGGHFSEGKDFTLFEVDGFKFGVLICFESTFPELSREFCRRGADFIFNITNDAWFLRTSAPYQHASALPLRAVENRIYIGRAANTGISMIVDPLGRVMQGTRIFTRSLITGTIHARSQRTFYCVNGDLAAYFSWFVLIVAAISLPFRTRRRGPSSFWHVS